MRVSLVQDCPYIVNALRLSQEASERVFAQVLEDDFHRFEVIFGPIFGAQQQEDCVDGLAIKRGEVDAARRKPDSRSHFLEAFVLDVGHGDASAEAC